MQPKPTPAPIPVEELKRLIEEAESSGANTMKFAGYRMQLCVRIGRALATYKKSVGHGGWMNWVESNLGGHTVQTARKWIKLAEAVDSGKLNLDDAKGVRQAYILAGLLPEPEESGSSNPQVESNYLVHLDRLGAVFRDIDLDKLTAEERQQIKARLQPIVEVYARLSSTP